MDWVDALTKLFGVVGQNIPYTLSPAIHNYIFRRMGFNAVYLAFDVSERRFVNVFKALLEVGGGFNITIPYKERVIDLLDDVDSIVEIVGAVNTVHKGKGYNTDYTAVKTLIKKTINGLGGDLCYIYGAGGAARAVAFALGELDCRIVIVNRSRDRAEKLVYDLQKFGVDAKIGTICRTRASAVVNATPLPSIVPDACLNAELVIEFVYKPVETDLVRRARRRGIKVIDGLSILVRQALEAQKIWTGISIPDEEVVGYLYARKLVW